MTWQFEHVRRYSEDPGDVRGTLSMIHKTNVTVRYNNGTLERDKYSEYDQAVGAYWWMTLDTDFVFPKRLGKRYAYGMDVSPGAKVNMRFAYTPVAEGEHIAFYRLKRVEKGISWIDLDDVSDTAVIKPVDLPFPVLDRIENEHGCFHVPFLVSENKEGRISFPSDVRKV